MSATLSFNLMLDSLRRGDRIPGSKLLRDFCAACEEPIRVSAIGRYRGICLGCQGHTLYSQLLAERCRAPHQRAKIGSARN